MKLSLLATVTVFVISFLFTSVAARAIAIVGTNPVSGMTMMTLILSSLVLVWGGLSGNFGMLAALLIGGVVCTALSMAGGFITDLKTGYWLGATPVKQQTYKFLGVLFLRFRSAWSFSCSTRRMASTPVCPARPCPHPRPTPWPR